MVARCCRPSAFRYLLSGHLSCVLPPPAKQAHPECGFDQDSRRRCMLAAVLLPIADLQVPVAKGKPMR